MNEERAILNTVVKIRKLKIIVRSYNEKLIMMGVGASTVNVRRGSEYVDLLKNLKTRGLLQQQLQNYLQQSREQNYRIHDSCTGISQNDRKRICIRRRMFNPLK